MNLNPLGQIDVFVIGATIVVFATTYFVLRRVFADRVVAVMEQRRHRCEEADRLCQEAEALVARAEQESRAIAAAAAEEAEGLVQLARERAMVEKAGVVADARARVEARLREGRATIEADKQLEVARVRGEAVECVQLACEKVVGEVDADVVGTSVDRVLARTIQ